MRRLHPVSLREKFIASGTYHFYDSSDVLLPYAEHWSVHEVGEGAEFIRVDHDGRAHNGSSILIEALRSPDGRVVRFDLRAYGGEDDAVKLARASYIAGDFSVQVQRFLDNAPGMQREEKPPYAHSLLIPSACFLLASGRYQEALRGEKMPVFLSHNIHLLDDTAFDVKYHMYNNLTVKAQEIIISGGKDYLATRLEYEDSAARQYVEWFNQQGVMLKAVGEVGIRAELVRYSGKA